MAGETALARQLKKLAAPQTSLLVQGKIRKSFLFDHREAAALDRDIIFAYGTTGVEKLKMMNPMFQKFEQNLFHISYKDFERSVQTSSVNKSLDEKITEFLRILTSYFLTRAAHEALEWLIYRFHIHLYNVDALMQAALPHYNTSSFVRVIQLLNLEEPGCRWSWLLPVQKSGVHLEFAAIVNHFNADEGFRKFICNLAPSNIKVFKENKAIAAPVVSFSMLTVYSALGRKGAITDQMITFLFPYILQGLKSGMNKYIAATYLVISRIMVSVKLAEELVNQLLVKVFEDVQEDLLKEACELLLLAFQQQKMEDISKDLFKLLVGKSSCIQHLGNMSENYEAAALASAIVKATVSKLFLLVSKKQKKKKSSKLNVDNFKKLYKFCKNIAELFFLDERNVSVFFNSILKGYSKSYSKSGVQDESLKKVAKVLLKSLESKYPEYFDKAIGLYFKKKKGDNKKHLCELINSAVCSLKNKVLPNKKTTLVLGVYHSDSHIRTTSVRYLLDQASSGKISDVEFVKNSLSSRLLDDSCEVVSEVLSSPDVLLKYIEKKEVLSHFDQILKKKIDKNSTWYPVQQTCLDIICNKFSGSKELSNEIFVTLLPFIFPLQKATAPGFRRILKSKLATLLPVIQVLLAEPEVAFDGKEENDAKQLVKLNNAVVTSLRKYITELSDSSKTAFLSFMKEKSMTGNYPPLLTVFVFASSAAITSDGSLNEKCVWIQNLLSFLNTFPRPDVVVDEFNPEMTDETAIQRCVHLLWKGHFPGVVVFYEFYKIVTLMKLDSLFLASNPWLFQSSDQNYKSFKILTLIFEFCVQQIKQSGEINSKLVFTNNLTNLFTAFVKYQLKNPEILFGYLSLLWSNVSEDVPVLLQVSAIETVQDSLDPIFAYNWCFENPVVFTSLLKAVSSPEVEVRKEALTLLQSLVKACSTLSCGTKSLSESICGQQEEIVTDHMHCFVVLNNWLNDAFEVYGSQKSAMGSTLKAKYAVLDSFIGLLLDENIPIAIKNHLLLFIQKADNTEILTALVPLINKSLLHFQNLLSPNELFYSSFRLLLSKFTATTASSLKSKCSETEVLFKCLEFVEKGQAKDSPIILPTLSILSRDFVKAIPSVEVQQKILNVLLSACLSSTADLNTEVKKVLRKLSTFAYLILKDFQDKETATQQSATLRDVKRSRTKEDNENSNMFETRPWKKITVLLEIIHNKSKLDQREILVQELFNLLNKTLNHDKESSVEYLRQLILSTIYNCCEQLGTEKLDERQFQVEYIVQCIRSSTNPKTHYLSLLLLNLAATMFPDYVLNNVMSIFTFMGSSLVRQDDSYSFQVISQTIETIVPSLLKASKYRNESDAMQVVAAVIRVFVDSLPDIPKHRQLPLFSKLITTLDPSQYLWVPLGQICDQYASVFPDSTSQDFGEHKKLSPTLDFAVNLHKQFSPNVQVDTCINLLNFISMLPDSKDSPEAQAVQNVVEPFNVSSHSDQQLQAYKYNVLSYVNSWLSSEAFVSQVSEMKTKALNKLECKYEVLLEKVLQYLQHLRDIQADINEHQKNLFPLLFDLVGHINSLLPCNSFIRVVQRLLKNSEPVIQKKAIELLCSKLENQQHLFEDEESRTYLLKLLRPLLKVVEKSNEDKSDKDDFVVSQQTALYALHLLTKVIGPEYSAKFHKVLNVTIQILNAKMNDELTVNALLCLAQLCSSMNVQVLPQLNTFMPLIIDLLTNIDVMQMNDCLVLGIITALMSIVQNLGAFLSSYMSSLVSSVCNLIHKAESSNKRTVCEKLDDFQVMLAADIDLRILLISIEESYSQFVKTNSAAIAPLVKLLEGKLTSCTYTEIESCSNQLQQFCISLLDFRNTSSTTSDEDAINTVELSIFSTLRTFVMKLSVTHFQSFFKKVYLWATATETKQPCRLFTFYGLTRELSKSLRSLFVVVAKTFLKNAASELDAYNSAKTSDPAEESNHPFLPTHLTNILDTLKDCFVNDDGHLLDKDSFDALLQPLVDQLENIRNDEVSYQKRIADHLGTCLAHFMSSVSDNALWKKLNYQILLKTRHDSAVVRFAAIRVIRDVVAVMGDNYLVLLAESIPFLAEVMEDESAEVEHECQSVIAEMEKILGEPIRKYF